ncbi:MAG: S-layer homology domain-containing protein, partial [Tissierellia bacterium]|nr:S-layer homology domain-containing protein [Tissierellia bacterium]
MKLRKILVGLLVVLIIFSSTSVMAAPFKDVPDSHWAASFIEDMKQLGYLKGYPDGSFKPSVNIKFIELMKVLSEFNKKHTGNTQSANDIRTEVYFKYDAATLDNVLKATPTWAQEYVLYALNKGIVTINELSGLHASKALSKSTNREDTMAYFAKAMGLEKTANEKLVASLPYTDASNIAPNKIKLLSVLLDNGVLSPEGKGKGLFKPKDMITRAEMAKMLSIAENVMGSAGPVDTNPAEDQVVPGNARGKIVAVPTSLNTGQNILTIQPATGNSISYNVTAKTKVKVEGKDTSFSSLVVGQEADVVYNIVNNEVLSITAMNAEESFEGAVTNISTDFTVIGVQVGATKKEYKFGANSLISINGKADVAKNISVNDNVKGTAVDGVIVKLDVEKLQRYEGTVKEVNPWQNRVHITYTVGTTPKDEWFTIDSSIKIIVDGKDGSITDLINGGNVSLAVRGDKLARIEVARYREVKGYITEEVKLVSDPNKDTFYSNPVWEIKVSTGSSTVTLKADRRTIFTGEGSYFSDIVVRRRPEDLQVGDSIEAKVNYDYATEIKATSQTTIVSGMVKRIATVWQSQSEITIVPTGKPNEEATYKLASKYTFKKPGSDPIFNSLEGLTNGVYVDLEIKNNLIVSITAKQNIVTGSVTGELYSVGSNGNPVVYYLEIREQGTGKIVRVMVPS